MSLSKKTLKDVRSPRSPSRLLDQLPSYLQARLIKVPTAGLKAGGFSEMLWKSATQLELKALNTQFIQGIKDGLLDPTDYGGYTVQDAIYCYNATEYLKEVERKAKGDQLMTDFIKGRIASFAEYTDFMFKSWHIANPAGISMGSAAQSYSDFERGVACKMDPFYFLIAMLPCEALWIWLAEQIKEGIKDTNVYSDWIEENLTGKHHLANFVDEHVGLYDIDVKLAIETYKCGMLGEFKFFQSATESFD